MTKPKTSWREKGLKFYFGESEPLKPHEPAHIHVRDQRGKEIHFWLKDLTLKKDNSHFKDGDRSNAIKIIRQKQNLFLEEWEKAKKYAEIKAGLREESSSESSDSDTGREINLAVNQRPQYQPQVEVQPAVQVQAHQARNWQPIMAEVVEGAAIRATIGLVAIGAVVVTTSVATSLATLNPLPLLAGLGFLARHYR